jgi:hypothetical protein
MTAVLWIALAVVVIAMIAALAAPMTFVARQGKQTAAALAAIHTLVNSQLTTARAEQLDATRVMLASLRELASFKESQGVPVSPEAAEAIELAQQRVDELARAVVYKEAQTDIADAQTERERG